jgi:phage terminase large subunit
MAEQPKPDYILRNNCGVMYASTNHKDAEGKIVDHTILLSGPSETGKTVACCLKVDGLCVTYPKAQVSMVRKTAASLPSTVVRTYLRLFDKYIKGGAIRVYGGETPERFLYANGSTIWLGGMDNPDRILSSERDLIYVNQIEEISNNDIEYISTRVTGRGTVVPPPQVQLIADCNPSHSQHWIRKRAKSGALTLLPTTHRDNPTLYDDQGNLTEQGERTLGVLDRLSGATKLRLKEGIWANQEGAIYDEFNPEIHVCERKESEMVSWFLCLDFGFTDPSVTLLVGADYDRRWHIFREFYKSGVQLDYHLNMAAEWNTEKQCEVAACDSARPEFIAWLMAKGVNAKGAEKGPGSIEAGIALIRNRMHLVKGDTSDGFLDGRPRLTISSFCTNTIRELEAYHFKPETDKPADEDNHAMDAIRYLAMVDMQGIGSFSNASTIYVPKTSGRHFTSRRFDGGRRY